MLGIPLLAYLLVSAWRRRGQDEGVSVRGAAADVYWATAGVLLLTALSAGLFPLSFIPFGMALFARRVDPRHAWLCVAAPVAVALLWMLAYVRQ